MVKLQPLDLEWIVKIVPLDRVKRERYEISSIGS